MNRIVFWIASMLTLALPAGAQTASEYRIYFDYQTRDLTQTADDVAATVAQSAAAANATEIDIVGHADAAEDSPGPLTMGRAIAVKAALIRHGLPASVQVIVEADGARHPFLPTAPGTREPLNRFVEVTVH